MIRPDANASAYSSEAETGVLRTAPVPAGRERSGSEQLYSIADLAAEFGISTRTIRFYEAKKLISPQRVGNTRVFRCCDRERLVLILRGKRLGFTLRDISDYLDLYDFDPGKTAAAALLDRRVGERIALLERQLADLKMTLVELRDIKRQTEAVLFTSAVQIED